MAKLISFDIDGTLEFGDPPGYITIERVRKAIPHAAITTDVDVVCHLAALAGLTIDECKIAAQRRFKLFRRQDLDQRHFLPQRQQSAQLRGQRAFRRGDFELPLACAEPDARRADTFQYACNVHRFRPCCVLRFVAISGSAGAGAG